MRGAVIHSQGPRSTAYVNAEGLPGEGLLEDTLAEVASEEEGVGAVGPQGSQKTEMGNADVLGFVNDGEVEDGLAGVGERGGKLVEEGGIGDEVAGLQFGTDAAEDCPQNIALRLWKAGLAAKADDIAVRIPTCQLPGVHNLFPFGNEEMRGEYVVNAGRGQARSVLPTWSR